MSNFEEILDKARAALAAENQQDAEEFVQLALENGGMEHPDALEVTAQLFNYAGDFASSKEVLTRAVEIDKENLADSLTSNSTSENANKINKSDMVRRLLALGEVNEGKQALELYQNSLSILEDLVKESQSPSESDSIQASLICCSISELYLTEPLCMESNAQSECLKFIGMALKFNEKNVDAWSLKSGYHISSCEDDLAKNSLRFGESNQNPKNCEILPVNF